MSWVKVNGLLYHKGLAWTGLLRLFHYPSCGGAQQFARLFIAYFLSRCFSPDSLIHCGVHSDQAV